MLASVGIDFYNGIGSECVEATIAEVDQRVKAAHAKIERICIEDQSRQSHRMNLRRR